MTRVLGEAGPSTCERSLLLSWPGLRSPPPPGVLNLTWQFGKTGNSNFRKWLLAQVNYISRELNTFYGKPEMT